ncbi:MAG TPA: carbamoyltransferase C-terminal domain-containing protein [Allosphingosinicella sp.]|jgi:predicted NodU family carbamoyl transferase|nr:carbamoyltransferase C-terminal domain-containing protein [Allosphingosinicella sp.]
MRILSYNPGHDGAVAYVRDGRLVFSIEAEKDSNYRYMPASPHDVLAALAHIDEIPDVVCVGGWWPGEARLMGSSPLAGYRGIELSSIIVETRRMFGRFVQHFSSSHERSHLLCAYGMSGLPKGTPCYALVWEGAIGAFYEINAEGNVTRLGDVMNQPGNRYCSIYGLADPTFPKNAPFSRFSDAGKLMALASFSRRSEATTAEEDLMRFLLSSPDVRLDMYDRLAGSPYFDVGVEDANFRDFAGIYSDRLFEAFHAFARANMRKGLPLVVAGGCGLNCDWNTKWVETGLFGKVHVPPVANDSGSAIGTAIDAQLQLTGDATIEWDVYAGLGFQTDRAFETSRYDVVEATPDLVADLLASDLILGWVNGRWEIGPRALGNRSILAAPFADATRIRLNEIKQREQFRPIAPVCLREDAARRFGCIDDSPHMLFTHRATTDRLAAVTHVNGTARLQTVTATTNAPLYDLLVAFRKRSGYGVLCNTSLNFNGRGFINNIADLDTYTVQHGLDGFVVEGRAYLLRASERYLAHRDRTGPLQTCDAALAGR